MRKGQHINIVIEQQGDPIVNFGRIWRSRKDMVAIEIDLATKYCGLDWMCGPVGFSIAPVISSDFRDMTIIFLPEFKDWRIWSASICKYSLNCCLFKE